MNDINNIEKFNFKNYISKNLHLIILIVIVFVLLVGGTFAYYAYSGSNSIFTGNMGKVDLTLTVTKVLPNTNKVDDILVVHTNELPGNLNSGCIDKEGEFALCQLYRINLVNASGSINTDVKGSIKFDNELTPNLSWVLLEGGYSASTNYTSELIGNNFNTSSSDYAVFEDKYLLNSGSSVDYYILVWINETEGEQNDMGAYSGTVKFEDSNGDGVTAEFGD